MSPHPSRRRVLQLTGAGATASLAGCSQFSQSNESSEDELEADQEPDIDPADGFTAVVQPSQEALAEVQQEVSAEVESGELSQQEAQREFQERQQEVYVSRSIEFESEMADDDELSIEAAIGERGVFLIDAPDERLVDTLRNEEVDGLLPGSEYEAILEAQSQQQAPEGTDPEGGNSSDEDADNETDGGNETDEESTDGGNESDSSGD